MSIIKHEIRKIWNWKLLLVIAAMCFLFFFAFMEFNISVMRDPLPHRQASDFAWELTQRYGSAITEAEMDAFIEEVSPLLVAEAEKHIRSIPIFAESGVYSYAEFRNLTFGEDEFVEQDDGSLVRNTSEMFSTFAFSPEANYIGARLDEFTAIVNLWDMKATALEQGLSRELFSWIENFYLNAIDAVIDNRFAELTAEHRASLEIEADELIRNNPIFASHGIANYYDFLVFVGRSTHDTLENRERSRVFSALDGTENNFVGTKLDRIWSLEFTVLAEPAELHVPLIEDFLSNHRHFNTLTENEHRRLTEILESGEYRNIMSFDVFNNATTYFSHLALMIMLAVLIFISPVLATDKMRNMQSVQYAAKIGRKLMYRQLAAVMISALGLAMILTAIFGALFYTSGMTAYWNHGTVSFLNGVPSLFPLTLGNLLVIMVAMALVLGVAIACIAFILSRYSRNILTALFKVIPVTVVLFFLNRTILGSGFGSRPFSFWNSLYRLTRIAGTEIVACILLLAIAFVAALWVSRRERRVDVA